MRNFRASIGYAYAVALLVMGVAAWMSLSEFPEDDGMITTAAAELNVKTQTHPDLLRTAELIIKKSNEFREEHGTKPVGVNSTLATTASYFARYMARTDKYSHTADGMTPSERAVEHGYDYCLLSENIAYVNSSAGIGTDELAERIVEVWKKSAEHRKNMVDPLVTESGVAVGHSRKTGNYYAVQLFGRPKSLSIDLTVENKSQVPIDYTLGQRSYRLPPRNRRIHEECLPDKLSFQLPDKSESQRYKFRFHDGDHFVISGPADMLKVEKK